MLTASATLDSTFIALSDATRRKILDRLSRGEARVTEIAAAFPISLNSVSKHLKLLERAALIERRVVGRDHFLRMRSEALDAAESWIAQKQVFWKAQLTALDALLSQEAPARNRTKGKPP
jgi:DNA-binding transcriptional ArsR family regulator